ncbi:MAG: dTDP-4-dehydrorhamnose reductase [Candidatus Omnitrophica bacterium]|nr:dTDP-4-dehydrorhamnose reductase [Candidatus Omnitrophota bacterium]
MKIVITGGNGLVGRYLSQILHNEKPFILSHKICDIADFFTLKRLLFKIKPEIIFHLAAFTNVDLCESDIVTAFKTNVSGTNNIAILAGMIQTYVIYVSTDFVFSGRKKTPYKETDEPEPLSIYGRTKLEGEQIISKNCDKYCIIRTSRIFGRNGENFASSLPDKLKNKGKIMITKDVISSPTYAKDLAIALSEISKKKFTGTIHFCNSGFCSWYEYGLYICEKLGYDSSYLIPVSIKNFPDSTAKRPCFSVLDTSLFTSYFYKPRSWNEALTEYLMYEYKM